MSARGFLEGTQQNPRDIAAVAYKAGPKWRDPLVLVEAVAVSLSESQGYDHARCENIDDVTGAIKSVDHGLWQINKPTLTPALWDLEANAKAAYSLYDRRGWQPWVAYNKGIYLHDSYASRAALGVMNFVIAHMNDLGSELPLPIWSTGELRNKLIDKRGVSLKDEFPIWEALVEKDKN